MRTLDGYDGSFAICRNDEEVRYAENVMCMQYDGTVDGVGKIFVRFGLLCTYDEISESDFAGVNAHCARLGEA